MEDEPGASSGSESKEMLNRQKDRGMSEGHGSQPERASNGQGQTNVSNKINDAVLNYSPKYKKHT